MKKIKSIALFTLALGLFACGEETKTSEESTTATTAEVPADDYKGMEIVNLATYGIDAEMYIADATKGKQEFRTTEWESLEIEVGKKYGIELVPFGLSVAEKKEELAGDLVYTIEYLEDTPSKIIYKKIIANNDIEEIHFLVNVDINGEPHTIKSLNKNYNEKAIQKMAMSAESLSVKNPA
ncbi:MAG: hypothetical protein JKY48_09365 [Flavobacteriales bacterium]|nr:hypothetical protein [Flavobacteriales bacterium]